MINILGFEVPNSRISKVQFKDRKKKSNTLNYCETFFLYYFLLLLAWPAKHINETGCKIFNVTLKKSCNPYY